MAISSAAFPDGLSQCCLLSFGLCTVGIRSIKKKGAKNVVHFYGLVYKNVKDYTFTRKVQSYAFGNKSWLGWLGFLPSFSNQNHCRLHPRLSFSPRHTSITIEGILVQQISVGCIKMKGAVRVSLTESEKENGGVGGGRCRKRKQTHRDCWIMGKDSWG